MEITVSSKYQVVIPKAVRKQLGIRIGQKLTVRAGKNGTVLLQQDRAADMTALIKQYAGSVKTADTKWGQADLDATDWLRQQRDEDWD